MKDQYLFSMVLENELSISRVPICILSASLMTSHLFAFYIEILLTFQSSLQPALDFINLELVLPLLFYLYPQAQQIIF